MGPWVVTPDEIGNLGRLHMTVRVNGEGWGESRPRAMKWSFEQLISYTSQDETLNPGDLFGSGTVNGGCGFEIEKWLRPGDTVEVEVEKIGVLRNRIGVPAQHQVNWRGQ